MKKFFYILSVVFFCASASVAFTSQSHAQEKCKVQKVAFDKASSDYTKTEATFTRLQQQVDSKAEQADYRRAILEGNVAQADANVKAAESSAIGQGLGCIFAPRGGCLGQTANRIMQQISRAKAMLKAQQGRLDAFNKATATQMTRLSESVTKQEAIVTAKKTVLDQKEAAYNACMAGK